MYMHIYRYKEILFVLVTKFGVYSKMKLAVPSLLALGFFQRFFHRFFFNYY
jgi:hypothetical protein